MEVKSKKGEIVTFYSFKGGTGRTMALANIAVLAARSNKKVLLIDWDLEAPGLHRYFWKYFPFDNDGINTKPGLIDLFLKIKELNEAKGDLPDISSSKGVLQQIEITKYLINLNLTGISILKAGAFNENYAGHINKFNWVEFFNSSPGFFRVFAEYLAEMFDYVFIDSRTGFTDSSGICTMLLPEKLCLVFTPNMQSLEGVCDLAKKALDYRTNSDDFRPLKIFPIPSRVELAEKDLREQWRRGSIQNNIQGFQPVFEQIFNEHYGLSNCDLTNYFDAIQVNHEPKFAYGEEIAVLNENFTDRLSLSKVYGDLFQKLTVESKIFSEPNVSNSAEENKIRVFISSSREDFSFARALKKQFEHNSDFDVQTSLNDNDDPGEDLINKLENEILNSHIFLPLISENSQSSKYSEFELYSFIRNKRSNDISMAIPVYKSEDLMKRNNSRLLNSLQSISSFDLEQIVNQVKSIVDKNRNLYISSNSSPLA